MGNKESGDKGEKVETKARSRQMQGNIQAREEEKSGYTIKDNMIPEVPE